MKNLMLLYSTLFISLGTTPVIAADAPFNVRMSNLSTMCFAETLKVQNDGVQASTTPCTRALLQAEPQSREEKSINYYNLAIIQRSAGNLTGALESLHRSVRLTRLVDMRRVALAQLAHQRGDLDTARENYRIIAATPDPAISTEVLEVITRNHHRLLAEASESEVPDQRFADHIRP